MQQHANVVLSDMRYQFREQGTFTTLSDGTVVNVGVGHYTVWGRNEGICSRCGRAHGKSCEKDSPYIPSTVMVRIARAVLHGEQLPVLPEEFRVQHSVLDLPYL